jgi:neutral ceramidase
MILMSIMPFSLNSKGKMFLIFVCVLQLLLGITIAQNELNSDYLIGTGIADMTGPSVEVNFMGYAQASQVGAGIHLRLRARAFIIGDTQNPEHRVVFVSIDGGMCGQLVKMHVIQALQAKFGNLYTADNVMISGTHTHSGPGGFLQV